MSPTFLLPNSLHMLIFLLEHSLSSWTQPSLILLISVSVQFGHSVVSSSFRPHGLQHSRPPCPSPTSGVYSNSCPLSQWCHPATSSSVVPFSSCPQSVWASRKICRCSGPVVSCPYPQILHLWIQPVADYKHSTQSTVGWICEFRTLRYGEKTVYLLKIDHM